MGGEEYQTSSMAAYMLKNAVELIVIVTTVVYRESLSIYFKHEGRRVLCLAGHECRLIFI